MSSHLGRIARKNLFFLFLSWTGIELDEREKEKKCNDGRVLIDQAIMLEAETTIVHLPVLTNKIMRRCFVGMLNVMHCSSSFAATWRKSKWERWKEIYKGKSETNFLDELLRHRHNRSSSFMLEWILHVMMTNDDDELRTLNDSFEISKYPSISVCSFSSFRFFFSTHHVNRFVLLHVFVLFSPGTQR